MEDHLNENIARPEENAISERRPNVFVIYAPVIDLESPDRTSIYSQTRAACRLFGFFQVIKHGVSKPAEAAMVEVAEVFFNLTAEERLKLYSDDTFEYIRRHCWPLHPYVCEWPSVSPYDKETPSHYQREVMRLGTTLKETISASLGLDMNPRAVVLGKQGERMSVNFYPPCNKPRKIYGLPAHIDPNALTILLLSSQVSDLQVLIDGQRFSVKLHPGALFINVGDQLQGMHFGASKAIMVDEMNIVPQNLGRLERKNLKLNTLADVKTTVVEQGETSNLYGIEAQMLADMEATVDEEGKKPRVGGANP